MTILSSSISNSLSLPQKLVIGSLTLGEALRNKAMGKFTEDTVVSLGSRLGASRGEKESTEIAFVEVLESVLAYFVPGLLANQVFGKLYKKIGQFNNPLVNTHSIASLYKQGGQSLVKQVLPLKLATLLSSVVLTAVCGENVLLFLKNLMTLKVFNTGSFNDIANLKNNYTNLSKAKDTETKEKAQRRIKQLLMIGVGLLLSSTAVVTFNPLKRLVGQLGNFYKLNHEGQATNRITQIINTLDFDYSSGKAAMKFPAHLALYMGISFIGYLDAARDRLEKKEVATRLPLMMGYLLFGQRLVSKLLDKTLFKNKTLHAQPTESLIKTLASANSDNIRQTLKQQRVLPQKLAQFILPYVIGGGLVFFLIALLSKHLTENRFTEETKAKQRDAFIHLAQQHKKALPLKNSADFSLSPKPALFKELSNQFQSLSGQLSTKQKFNH